MKRFFSFLALVLAVNALTDDEAAKFSNSGAYCGTIEVTDNGDTYRLVTNGVPNHEWEDVNPNDVMAQSYSYQIPKNPTEASTPGCLPGGPIGIAVNGVPIYNPLTSRGLNAVEGSGAETFDKCDGHPDNLGRYHYHSLPGNCVYKGNQDELLGVALDGFPIYGPLASDLGRDLTSADLDECHGRMVGGEYRYHFTRDFPYALGCIKGTVGDNLGSISYNCQNAASGELCSCEDGQLSETAVTAKKQLRNLLDLIRDSKRFRRETGEMVEVIDNSACSGSTGTGTGTGTNTGTGTGTGTNTGTGGETTGTTGQRPKPSGGDYTRPKPSGVHKPRPSRKSLIKKAVMDMLEFLETELDEDKRSHSNETSGESKEGKPGNGTSGESKDRPKPTGEPSGETTGKPPKDGKKPKPPGDRRQMPEPTGEPSRERTGEPSNSKPSGEKSGETTGKPPKDGNMKKNTLKRLLEMMNLVN